MYRFKWTRSAALGLLLAVLALLAIACGPAEPEVSEEPTATPAASPTDTPAPRPTDPPPPPPTVVPPTSEPAPTNTPTPPAPTAAPPPTATTAPPPTPAPIAPTATPVPATQSVNTGGGTLPPHILIGKATIGGSPAPVGTKIVAFIRGIEVAAGEVIKPDGSYSALQIPQEQSPGSIVTFTVGGTVAPVFFGDDEVMQMGGADILDLNAG